MQKERFAMAFLFKQYHIDTFAKTLRYACRYAKIILQMPEYHNKYSKKEFTLHQLFAICYLKECMLSDYRLRDNYLWNSRTQGDIYCGVNLRNIIELIRENNKLQKALKLKKIPHYSTLSRAQKFFLEKYGYVF